MQVDPYYYCSDYDLGGVPSWLLGDLDLPEREKIGAGLMSFRDEKFLARFTEYLDSFLWFASEAQAVYGGPIIAFQIQYYEPELAKALEENALFRFYGFEYVELIQRQFYRHSIVEILLKSVSTCALTDGMYCDHDLKIYYPVIDPISNAINNLVYTTDQILIFRYFYEVSNCVGMFSIMRIGKYFLPCFKYS